MKNYIDLKPIKRKKISPKAYMQLSARKKGNIARSRFIPPKIGSQGFGYFELIFKHPVYQNFHE